MNDGCCALFVTGTDTDVGKTYVASALLRSLAHEGLRVVGMKPVSAGFAPGTSQNADVATLADASNVDAPLADRNPFSFADPVAPHLAAERSGRRIELATIAAAGRRLMARADALVVEGAGGALVPLDPRHDMLDIASALDMPVLLVVGMRLGCLNHALLSALAIARRGLVLRGWVANDLAPPMALVERNVCTLTERLGAPPVAIIGAGDALSFDRTVLSRLGFAMPGEGAGDDGSVC